MSSAEELVIFGDLNIHWDKPDDCDSIKLLDLIISSGHKQHVVELTLACVQTDLP